MKFQAIKGVRDILPPDSALWSRVEQAAREVFGAYGYGEIRLPIFEPTELFARAIGAETDVVSKEMYTFEDFDPSPLVEYRNAVLTWQEPAEMQLGGAVAAFRPFADLVSHFEVLVGKALDARQIPLTSENERRRKYLPGEREIFVSKLQSQSLLDDRSGVDHLKELVRGFKFGDLLTLRPEATASVARAYIEHGMKTWPQPVKLYYIGPMFRRERPQKGRYRQFYQIGAELLGRSDDAALDAEVIQMLVAFFHGIGLQSTVLSLNSIGDRNCRPQYIERLREELRRVKHQLGPDSQRRIETNTLRVLDSKVPEEQAIIEKLPRIAECLCDACREHYAELKRQLALRNIDYQENWRLVRGLDYYMRTTFEVTATGLGSQDAVCGGGRYDGLVEQLGGPAGTKGIGFAIGTDRLILSLQQQLGGVPERKDATVAVTGLELRTTVGSVAVTTTPNVYLVWMGQAAHAASISLSEKLRNGGLVVESPTVETKLRKSLDFANRLGAQYAVIIGDNELASGEFTVKRLADGDQKKLSESDLLAYLLPRTQ